MPILFGVPQTSVPKTAFQHIAAVNTFFDLATRLNRNFPPWNQHFWWSKFVGFNPFSRHAGYRVGNALFFAKKCLFSASLTF
jgi:hypothetical protein